MTDKTTSHRCQRGMSLVELMISMAIGLIILAGVTTIFVSNNKTRQELEKTSRQVENGRYAMQLLTEDLQMAGFLGTYVPPGTAPGLTALPNPCATDLATIDGARLLHIQGYDNPSSTTISGLTCLSDVKSGTDILVVRRASTCAVGAAGCDAFLAGAPHLQVSGCLTDTAPASPYVPTGQTTEPFYLFTTTANPPLRKVSCAVGATADVRRYRTHIYFIANNNIGSDGIPTLKRAELGADATGATAMTIVPLVDGIENMQFEYGIDSNNDGTPDSYTADPSSGCSGNACVQNWWNAMAVKISLLARNTQSTPGYTDSKTYTLGLDASGHAYTVTPGGSYRRHEYSSTVRLANPAGRRP
ncbi:MAG TPA: PilW family protein [Rhodocyclaceae bacterium]